MIAFLKLFILLGQKSVELIGEVHSVALIQGIGAAGLNAAAAHGFHKVTHG